MSIKRDTIPFGPAKIVRGALTFWTAKELNVVVTTEYADVDSDQFGQGTKNIVNQIIEVEGAPQSIWALLASVWAAADINPAINSRIITAVQVPTVIHGEDGSLLTIPASGIIDIPSLAIGVDKGEFGNIKIVGVCANGFALGDEGSVYTYEAAGGVFGNPSNPDYLAAGAWGMEWGDNVLAGDLLEAVTIKPDFKVEPVKAGKRILDYRRKGCQFSAEVVASANLEDVSGLHNDGATFLYGQRNSTAAHDLVFTAASGHAINLKAAAMMKAAMKFASLEQRQQGAMFETTGLTGARVVITTPA